MRFGNRKLVFNKPINFHALLLLRVRCDGATSGRDKLQSNGATTFVVSRTTIIIYRTKPQGTMGHYTVFALFIVRPCRYYFVLHCIIHFFCFIPPPTFRSRVPSQRDNGRARAKVSLSITKLYWGIIFFFVL